MLAEAIARVRGGWTPIWAARHILAALPDGWRLTRDAPSAELVALREELYFSIAAHNDPEALGALAKSRALTVLADTAQAAEEARAAIEAPWREALSKHRPFKLADYERCGHCAQHWPCDAETLLKPAQEGEK